MLEVTKSLLMFEIHGEGCEVIFLHNYHQIVKFYVPPERNKSLNQIQSHA